MFFQTDELLIEITQALGHYAQILA